MSIKSSSRIKTEVKKIHQNRSSSHSPILSRISDDPQPFLQMKSDPSSSVLLQLHRDTPGERDVIVISNNPLPPLECKPTSSEQRHAIDDHPIWMNNDYISQSSALLFPSNDDNDETDSSRPFSDTDELQHRVVNGDRSTLPLPEKHLETVVNGNRFNVKKNDDEKIVTNDNGPSTSDVSNVVIATDCLANETDVAAVNVKTDKTVKPTKDNGRNKAAKNEDVSYDEVNALLQELGVAMETEITAAAPTAAVMRSS